jgi:hypothetical protein
MAVVPSTPLANPQFLVPDFATPLKEAFGAIKEQRQQREVADLGEQALGADTLEQRNKTLLKIAQIDPQMAESVAGMLGTTDAAKMAQAQAETKKFGDFHTALYRLESKPERDAFIKAEIRRRQTEGEPFDKLESLLGMSDVQQRMTALQRSVASGFAKDAFAVEDARLKASAEAQASALEAQETRQKMRLAEEKAQRDARAAEEQSQLRQQQLATSQQTQKIQATEAQAEQEAKEKQQQQAAAEADRALAIADKLLKDEKGLRGVSGGFDRLSPTFSDKSLAIESDIEELSSLLTIGNLDRMSGALSDSDIALLKQASAGLDLRSEERLIGKLKEIRDRLRGAKENRTTAQPTKVGRFTVVEGG